MSLPSPSSAGQHVINASGIVMPDWLRKYTVEQDCSRYTSVDHAVWRFVLLQMHERLKTTAHPAYARGLKESGISCERIPSVEEMNHCLGRIGWGAVCVDGFIPPRAFQAFQAAGILPIAAEIRSPEHLPYTPAPDIIHEAAGHAPILQDPAYAAYIRASGEVAARAFASPLDHAVYAAIFALSALKEDPEHNIDQLRSAEVALEQALAATATVSEAARVARLYWWTAEYGLVGTPSDYKLYGAGLLSSLWESHACHDPMVTKRLLTADCVNVDYDITRAQPQLFVARDFEQLSEVLAQVDATLAYRKGGQIALAAAHQSEELCTVSLEGDFEVVGRVGSLVAEAEVFGFEMRQGWQWVHLGQAIADQSTAGFVPLGPLTDGTRAAQLRAGAWVRYLNKDNRLNLAFASGLRVTGALLGDPSATNARTRPLELRELSIQRGDELLYFSAGRSCLILTDHVLTAAAGSRYPAGSPPGMPQAGPSDERPRVPKLRPVSEAAARLQGLYSDAFSARTGPPGGVVEPVRAIRAQLTSELSNEWLLRWNLLDCLVSARQKGEITDQLRAELEALELHYERRHPIKMGLEYLAHTAP